MNLANKITIARVFMIPAFLMPLLAGDFLGLSEQNARVAACAIFILAALTDMLDGYIARKYNMITDFGKFMDPLADKLLVMAALVVLVAIGDIYAWVVILILAREFIISGYRMLAASKNIVIAAGIWGKLKTVSQMIMIILLLVAFQNAVFVAVGRVLIYLSAALTVISAADYIIKNISVLKESSN